MTAPHPPANWLAKAALVLDPYERQARLSPAALCLAPFMVMTVSLYSSQLWSLAGLAGLVGTVGLLYLLADVARSLGKKHEARLWTGWGGAPSTQVLRHRDDVFDTVTKRRYHEFLGKKVKADFPTKAVSGWATRDQADSAGARQRCGSSSAMRLAGWVGSRVSTSLR